MGWFDPILVFFIAPFIGLAWTLLASIGTAFGSRRRELPYGPHLAVAAVFVLLARPLVISGWDAVLPLVPMPARVLSTEPIEAQSFDSSKDRMSTWLDRRHGTGFNEPGIGPDLGLVPLTAGDRLLETPWPRRAS